MTPPRRSRPWSAISMSPSIVHYAMGNARVSGIQRVQLNLIGHLVRRLGGDVVRCTFEHPHRKEMLEFDPTTLFESDEFDAAVLLRAWACPAFRASFRASPACASTCAHTAATNSSARRSRSTSWSRHCCSPGVWRQWACAAPAPPNWPWCRSRCGPSTACRCRHVWSSWAPRGRCPVPRPSGVSTRRRVASSCSSSTT